MIRQAVIMYAVALVLILIGAGSLLLLLRQGGPARTYVLRMVGIMALSAGVVLAVGANAMQRWSVGG